MASVIPGKQGSGRFYGGNLRTRDTLPILKQRPVAVSNGRLVEAPVPSCEQCNEPFVEGEYAVQQVPPPGSGKAWLYSCTCCAGNLKERIWDPSA